MKTRMFLLIALLLLSLLHSETMVIQKTDGTTLQFNVANVIDMTFDNVVNESIQIHKIDTTFDEIAISVITNIEFVDTPNEAMQIHKTDGTTYEIDTALIENIVFGEITSIDNVTDIISYIPISFLKNYPNPFNPETSISFKLNEAGFTRIDIYNVKGEKINTILEESLPIGTHSVEWHGEDANGNASASGVYFYKITVNSNKKIHRMLLLK